MEKLRRPAERREVALRLMAEHGLSQRRACALAEVGPKTVRRDPVPDSPEIRARLRALAGERRRFGYRRLGILLEREGIVMNRKKLFRLYSDEGLSVRRPRGRKRATGTRAPMAIPQEPNQRWSLDFVSDVLCWGRRFRVLAVVDDFTREALALVVDSSIPGGRVVRELEALIAWRGAPLMIVSDNGSELTSRAVLDWTNRTGIEWRPPWASDRWRPHGEPSRPASRSRTRSSRASTPASGMNARTRRSSAPWPRRARSSKTGDATSTSPGRTPLTAD